jgi:cytochrome c553
VKGEWNPLVLLRGFRRGLCRDAGMRLFGLSLELTVVVVVWTTAGVAAERPGWAYPVNPPGARATPDDGSVQHVPDSSAGFTRTQLTAIGDKVADWHPDEHPPMPSIVAKTRAPVSACGYCHLPNGAGRPENASLAGLTPTYIKQQMAAFRSGDRKGDEPKRAPENNMIALAKAATDAEIEAAATYFAALKPRSFTRLVETDVVPKTIVAGWTLTLAPGGGTEPTAGRLIEMPEDFERFEQRDSRTPYVAYVPVGSIKRGEDLVKTGGGGKTLQCAVCHGPELKGLADVPRLVGRSPGYVVRQLYDLQQGARKGGTAELMKPTVANLNVEDMVAIAAYLASREP